MRVEPQKITKRLYSNNGTRGRVLFRYGFLKKDLAWFPSIPPRRKDRKGVFGPPIRSGTGCEEISAEDFGYAEDEMSVRNGLEDLFAEPLTEFHDPFFDDRMDKNAFVYMKMPANIYGRIPHI